MSGNNTFSRSASRHRFTVLDVDDDGEPFEQDPPPGFFEKTAQNSVRPKASGAAVPPAAAVIPIPHAVPSGVLPAEGDSAPADTYFRSSELLGSRRGRQTRRDTRIAPDITSARHASEEGDARSFPQPVKQSSKAKRSLRGRALAYLSRREHSRDELARKLTPFIEASDGDDPVPAVLNRLAEEGWLSDARFAQSVVNRRAARFGSARIVGELKRHKVDSDTVQTISECLRDTEWERISDVWARKFGVLAVTQQERAKQARFLASRGFSHDAIMRIIKAGHEDMPEEE
jgi:regulatory protein